MSEENVEEILEIEDTTVSTPKSGGILDHVPDADTPDNQNEASNGLIKASNVCKAFMWLGIILAIIGALVFLANIGEASEGYSWSAKYQTRCEGGISCVIYGIADAIFSYVFSKVLIGLSVMTRASESYLKDKK